MNTTDGTDSRIESVIASVYSGPLADFVRRRDALAKKLRSTGDRESAAAVKALRKPSRISWALNLGALESRNVIDALVDAVAATLDAQASGGDVRGAIAALRKAVREFANQAAEAAGQYGHRIEQGILANAVLAVLGQPDSFDKLRAGSLVDIPEAGGLDFLAGLPTPSGSPPPDAGQAVALSSGRAQREEVDRDAALAATCALDDARARAEVADEALRQAESKLNSAEAQVRLADEQAQEARRELDRVRREADAAAAQVREAELAVLTIGRSD